MRTITFLAACLLLLLAACSPKNDKIFLTSGSTILAFGDSLTKGVGADSGHSYPDVLSAETGITVINSGVSGEVSSAGLLRLKQQLESTQPNLVILCHGGNDILRRLPLDALETNLDKMIKLIKSYRADVLIVAVPKPALSLKPLPLYKSLAKHHNLAADLNTLSDLFEQSSMKSDRFHLNNKGYRALALAIGERIEIMN